MCVYVRVCVTNKMLKTLGCGVGHVGKVCLCVCVCECVVYVCVLHIEYNFCVSVCSAYRVLCV